MRKFIVIIFAAISTNVVGQKLAIEPFAGLQTNLNKTRFTQLNTGLQLAIKADKNYELLLQLQQSWPIKKNTVDSAFTTNPALPLYAGANKTMKAITSTFAIGHRFTVARVNNSSRFNLIAYTGIVHQKIKVDYEYNKDEYTILNPDKTMKRTGVYVSGGVEYMRQFKNGSLFLNIVASTPPSGKKLTYPSSFYFIAPLAFNAGYSINLKKN